MRPGERMGPYELTDLLGRGGVGSVFRARSPDGREVALKVLNVAGGERIARFAREQRLQAALGEAEGFVPLLDGGATARGPYLVMPLLPGGTLRDRLEKGPLAIDEARAIVLALAKAMAIAHARGIVHRDLKPENVLFAADGRPLVADLGLAKHFRDDTPGASQSVALTKAGELKGTPGYMAPEQAEDAALVGPAADVFALGAILYEGIAGERAFAGDSGLALLAAVASGSFVPLARRRSGVPRWLAALVERSLARDPEARHPDAGAFAAALEAGGPARGPGRGRLVAGALVVLVASGGALGALRLRGGAAAPGDGGRAARAALEQHLAARGAQPALTAELARGLARSIDPANPIGLDLLARALEESPSRELASVAHGVASARLVVAADDARARLVRALAARVAVGAAARALAGPPLATRSDEVAADLEAASALPGDVGRRAARLLVEELAASGPSYGAPARAALARLADGSPASAVLELALATDGVAAFSALRERAARDELALRGLALLLAHRGAPEAVEHVELAREPDLARALAADPPGAFALKPLVEVPFELLQETQALDELVKNTLRTGSSDTDAPGVAHRRFVERRAEILRSLAKLVQRAPHAWQVQAICADSLLESLATLAFRLLMGREQLNGACRAALDFDPRDRAASRLGFMGQLFQESVFEAETIAEFDRRLDEHAARPDEPFAIATATRAYGDALPRALLGVRALKRVELIRHGNLAPAERDRLAFEALVFLEELGRLGGPTVLGPRAWLRAKVLPEPLGRALARLDLARAFRVVGSVKDPRQDTATWLYSLAAIAFDLGLDQDGEALARYGREWAFEQAFYWTGRYAVPGQEDIYFRERLGEFRNEFMKSYMGPVASRYGERLEADLRPRPGDERRLGKPYAFVPPTAPRRPD